LEQRQVGECGYCTFCLLPPSFPLRLGANRERVREFSNYPLDVLKSRLQTDSFPSEGARKYPRGMTDAIPALYNEGGAGAFFRGLGPTMIRYVSAYLSIPSLARTLEGAGT